MKAEKISRVDYEAVFFDERVQLLSRKRPMPKVWIDFELCVAYEPQC